MKTYDPTKVTVTVGSYKLSGFSEGSLVKCERNQDSFKLTVGGDGHQIRSKSPDRSGKITVTLLQSSASNEFLSSLAVMDETGTADPVTAPAPAPNGGIQSVTVKDLNGNTVWSSPEAWVMKPPSASFEKEAKDREWVLECGVLAFQERGQL